MEQYFNVSELNSSMNSDVVKNKHYLMLVSFIVVLVLGFYFGYFKGKKDKRGKKISTRVAVGSSIGLAAFVFFVILVVLILMGRF